MLIDKDLRLSISGCFWLFYASKYKENLKQCPHFEKTYRNNNSNRTTQEASNES